MDTKQRTIFQKQIVATKMRTFFSFRTQIAFAYVSEKSQIQDDLRDGRTSPSKGAPRMHMVKSFQSGSHVNQQVPHTFVNSPLPIESFLHTLTPGILNTRHQEYALQFDITCAGVTSTAFNLSALIQQRWHSSVDWSDAISQTNLLTMYQKRETLKSTLHAMGLDYKRLPDPWYQRANVTDQIEATVSHHESS